MKIRRLQVADSAPDPGIDHWFTAGLPYLALGVFTTVGQPPRCQVLCDVDQPVIENLNTFAIIEPTLSNDWAISTDRDGRCHFAPKRLLRASFWPEFFDDDLRAVAEYEQVLRSILTADKDSNEPSPVGLEHAVKRVRPPLGLRMDPDFVSLHASPSLAQLAEGQRRGWITAGDSVTIAENVLLQGRAGTERQVELASIDRWNEPAINALLQEELSAGHEDAELLTVWMNLAVRKLALQLPRLDVIERFFVDLEYPEWMNGLVFDSDKPPVELYSENRNLR